MLLVALWACAKTDPVATAPASVDHVVKEDARPVEPRTVTAPEPAADAGDAEAGDEDVEADDSSDDLIVIKHPREGAVVTRDLLSAKGTATAFEGRINLRLRQGDDVLVGQSVQVSAGAPEEGTWMVQLQIPAEAQGEAVLEAYTTSAKDGSEQNVVGVTVTLGG